MSTAATVTSFRPTWPETRPSAAPTTKPPAASIALLRAVGTGPVLMSGVSATSAVRSVGGQLTIFEGLPDRVGGAPDFAM
jgi:hypothetical protein